MLPETLTALAAAGGTAVVQAAGTDAWQEFRQRVAAWFGRGEQERESTELERLDRTASELRPAAPPDGGQPDTVASQQARIRQEALWQARFEALLENLPDTERDRAAGELRDLLADPPAPGVSAGAGGQAVGGDLHVRAEGGSVAAGVIHGGVQMGHPPQPDPSRG
ncbi:hypothetical protein [Streptomyces barkulensis]|uniref:hypothetical protein n=1 Tax=Streptomyces barkulensis TaxID=1257026 RepID=UPI000C6CB91D|nr:hypothetical protein [Streptomyces barkulensis]